MNERKKCNPNKSNVKIKIHELASAQIKNVQPTLPHFPYEVSVTFDH